MDHSPAFRLRRFLNWFPLGLTYAAMYMGRYNFNIVKNDIGAWYHLDKWRNGGHRLRGLLDLWFGRGPQRPHRRPHRRAQGHPGGLLSVPPF